MSAKWGPFCFGPSVFMHVIVSDVVLEKNIDLRNKIYNTVVPGRNIRICIYTSDGAPGDVSLTHLSLDKMAVVSQTIFSDAFSWMTIFLFFFYEKCHWSLFLGF